ncbi:MAG: radical SAM protein [Armatimonadetes bacterium]|nr:radical SAM protein [Armatimonadota bacterium]
MGTCAICGDRSELIADALGVCAACLRAERGDWRTRAERAHAASRQRFGLPGPPPRTRGGLPCPICVNNCRIGEGERGYCGVRQVVGRQMTGGEAEAASVDWYHDPLPTNCVADWVCPAGTGAGYPQYAYRDGPETGYLNLAVFYRACSFDCLFCQNWHFRQERVTCRSPQSLAAAASRRTACICYFGGDPTPQLPHALAASRLALEQNPDRILRICWETNGSMNRALLDEMIDLSLRSGGCLKFDLKAHTQAVHVALCGVTNERTLRNFRYAARFRAERLTPPLLVASTLMVPGYVDEAEVASLARFIANIDPDIPYSLLAFAPQFEMYDLPTTSRAQADACLAAAWEAGLTRVRIGNVHLLTR